jgi:hypothetical protein
LRVFRFKKMLKKGRQILFLSSPLPKILILPQQYGKQPVTSGQ